MPPKRKAEDPINEETMPINVKYFWGNLKDYVGHAWDVHGKNWPGDVIGKVNSLKETGAATDCDVKNIQTSVDTLAKKTDTEIAAVKTEVSKLETSVARTSEHIVKGQEKLATFERSLKLQNQAIHLLPKTSTITDILQRLEKLEKELESHSQTEQELGRLKGRNEILERELKLAEQNTKLLSSQLDSQRLG